jgi:hypothetical protein
MGVNIKGGNNSVGLANVTSNYDLNVVTPDTTDAAGFAHMSAQNDDGTVTGSVFTIPAEISDDYRLRVGQDQTMFNLSFEGTNQATGHLQFTTTGGPAIAQANGFLSLNNGGSVAASGSSYVRTYRTFPLFGTYPTYTEFWLRESEYDTTFAISEWGLFQLATTTSIVAPTDGIYFRRLPSGGLRGVVNYNGSETVVEINTANVPPRDGSGVYAPAEVNHYLISVHNDVARFWINDTLVGSIECPSAQPALASASSAPLSLRVYVPSGNNSGAARKIELGWVNVSQGDMNTNKPWGHAMVGAGGGSYQVQPGNASLTLPITANYVVNAAPGAMTLSNTTTPAATYASLGGQYQFTVPATAAETDFIMFGWQNPVGTATLPGKTLYITGVRIGEAVVTTLLSAHYHYLQWGIGANAAALTLATVNDTALLTAYRRVTLGGQGFLVSAPIGTTAPGFQVDFNSAPLICAPGNYVSVIMRDVSNASSATGAIRGNVTIIGYFE